jgi:hypothetical protein
MTTLEAQIDGKTAVRKNIMRKLKYMVQTLALVSALVMGASLSARASVTMTYTDSGTFALSGFPADSAGYINSSDLVGIYKFDTSGGSVPNPFYSVCLSPAGLLDRNSHTYDVIGFSAANPGINPPNWAYGTVAGVPQYWGIQNASWLWNTYGMNIVNNTGGIGFQNQRAAALEFAIWTALYDSTGYGAVGSSPWQPNGLGSGANSVGSSYSGYLTALNATGGNIPLYTGNILRGTSYTLSGQQQEFLMLGTPIPEPTTILAGALLLLPFGASTLRILRQRNRDA